MRAHYSVLAATATVMAILAPGGLWADEPPKLNCVVGPVTKTFAKTDWLVYGCDDGRSLAVVTAAGNPAMPFFFFVHVDAKGVEVSGEGDGDKRITDAVFADLKALSEPALATIYAETAAVKDRVK